MEKQLLCLQNAESTPFVIYVADDNENISGEALKKKEENFWDEVFIDQWNGVYI